MKKTELDTKSNETAIRGLKPNKMYTITVMAKNSRGERLGKKIDAKTFESRKLNNFPNLESMVRIINVQVVFMMCVGCFSSMCTVFFDA